MLTLLLVVSLSASASAATVPAGFTDAQVTAVGSPTALPLRPTGGCDRHPARQGTPPHRRTADGGARPRPRLVRLLQRRRGLLGIAVDPSSRSITSSTRRTRTRSDGTCVNRVSRPPGRGRRRLVERGGALRQHPQRHKRRARGRQPGTSAMMVILNVRRGRRILRLRQGQRLQLKNTTSSRDPHELLGKDPADHSRRGSGARQSIRRSSAARCNSTGRTTGRPSVPGDVRVGAAQPLPFCL